MLNNQLQKHQEQPLAATPDTETSLQFIKRAATDASVDVHKMKELLQMHLQLMALDAEKRFNDAMREVQAQMPAIVKDSLNPSTNSAYVKLDKIQDVVTPIMLQHGFTLSFGTDESKLADHYGVSAQLSHISGHTRHFRADVPIDDKGAKGNQNKTRTHGFGSAISYGQRYLLKLIFNIRLIGEDDDGNKGNRPKAQTPNTQQSDTVRQLAVELWNVCAPIRGDDRNKGWEKINEFLLKHDLIDGAVEPPQRAPHLSEALLKSLIPKAKGLL